MMYSASTKMRRKKKFAERTVRFQKNITRTLVKRTMRKKSSRKLRKRSKCYRMTRNVVNTISSDMMARNSAVEVASEAEEVSASKTFSVRFSVAADERTIRTHRVKETICNIRCRSTF